MRLRLTFVDAPTATIRSEQPVRLGSLFVNQVLPYFDQYALSHRFWAPDSEAIVLPVDNDLGVPQITSFLADGSDPVDIVDGAFATWSP